MAYSSSSPGEKNEAKRREGFGEYLRQRDDKFQAQLRVASAGGAPSCDRIFEGVSIYIDGYTEPSSDVLRSLVVSNGGRVVQWFSKSTVTHIIATALARQKLKDWANVNIVTPSWLIDCAAQGTLLPLTKYKLSQQSSYQAINNLRTEVSYSNAAAQCDDPGTGNKAYVQVLKAGDDGFIEEFYKNSRLHHLSAWRVEVQEYVASKRGISNKIFTGLSKLMKHDEAAKSHNYQTENIESLIMHIDLDCFFVSAGLQNRRELIGKAVVVTHSTGQKRLDHESYAEVASCSYEARKFGVTNGMLLGKARQLCPNLIPIPYDFEIYDKISHTFYDVILTFTNEVEAVSCDEAYVDLLDILKAAQKVNFKVDITTMVSAIRREVFEATGCSCSAGVGPNRLIARLATKKAKPNGQRIIESCEINNFLRDINLRELPGVGGSLHSKLVDNFPDVTTCNDLRAVSQQLLCETVGNQMGKMLFDACRGISNPIGLKAPTSRKSVSVEINYGMRFDSLATVEKFVGEMVDEVVKRLGALRGSKLTLKLRLRRPEASHTTKKFLGCGFSDVSSQSVSLCEPTNLKPAILAASIRLLRFGFGKFDPVDVRGLGIQITKLTNNNCCSTRASEEAAAQRKKTDEQGVPNHKVSPKKAMKDILPPCPRLAGTSSEDVSELIREWMSTVLTPSRNDISMISDYLSKLVIFGDLSLASRLLREIFQISQENGSFYWADALNSSILPLIQRNIEARYGRGIQLALF